MSDWPETREDLLERFTSDADPVHREMFTKLMDEALSRPNPSYLHLIRDGIKVPNMTPSDLAHTIYDHNMVFPGFSNHGWIDTEGRFWSCSYASHERLLELMDMNSIEQEYRGWVKISAHRAHARHMPNDAQMATLNRVAEQFETERGIKLDLKPLMGLPPLKSTRYLD